MKPILVTGAAGFIGYHLCQRLLHLGYSVVGLDNLNSYYLVELKQARLENLKEMDKPFQFEKMSIEEVEAVESLFQQHQFDYVFHLAAQAGVRYSQENPHTYIDSNIRGFLHILEGCRHHQVKHLVFASSSSVYGLNRQMPFSTHHPAAHPISLYGATKKANELMAHSYSYQYQIPCTGLRFFTVYGPWGRPDMAYFKFAQAIVEGRAIDVYNYGKCKRDFTYVDDIVEGMVRLLDKIPSGDAEWSGSNPDPAYSLAPYAIYNIGNNQPVELERFIEIIEENLGKKGKKNLLPLPSGDLPETYAEVSDLMDAVGFKPQTSIEEGLKKFITWYKTWHNIPD